VGCSEDENGFVETFPSVGVLHPDNKDDVKREDFPEAISRITVDGAREHVQEVEISGERIELIARYHPAATICVSQSCFIIPKSLIHPDLAVPFTLS
jgi:hypothetical protein